MSGQSALRPPSTLAAVRRLTGPLLTTRRRPLAAERWPRGSTSRPRRHGDGPASRPWPNVVLLTGPRAVHCARCRTQTLCLPPASRPGQRIEQGKKRLVTQGSIPDDLAHLQVGDLTEEQIYRLLEGTAEGGIRLTFAGKETARQIMDLVRPRVMQPVKRLSYGQDFSRVENLVIDGDNLQSMVTLYKYRGQVDLILTDPPYNTGNDFRYNDRWDTDPNDDGLHRQDARLDDLSRADCWPTAQATGQKALSI